MATSSGFRNSVVLGLWAAVLGVMMAGARAAVATVPARLEDEYVVTRWGTEDGLPEFSVNAMVERPDGYLWFGTFKGLVRFDGVKMKVFDELNTPELKSASIVNLHLDRGARMWVSTDNGMACRQGQAWRTFGPDEGWTGDYARSFAEDRSGALVVSTFNGRIFQEKEAKFHPLPNPPGEERKGYFIHVDEAGMLWAAQSKFFGRLEGESWTGSDPSALFPGENLTGAGPSRDGGWWVVFNQRLRKFKGGRWIPEAERPVPRIDFWSLYEDSKGCVWISSYNSGLYQVEANGALRQFHRDNGLSHNQVRFTLEDRESSLWIGTSGGGLMRLKKKRFLARRVPSDGFVGAYRVVLELGPDRMLAGMYGGGVGIVDGTNFTRLGLPRNPPESGYVTSALRDRHGRYWIGTYLDQVYLLDGERKEHLLAAQTGGNDILAMHEDAQGDVWLGTNIGVTRHGETGPRVFGPDDGLPRGTVFCIAENRATGRLWFGTERHGLFEHVDGRFRPIPLDGVPAGDSINCLWFDPEGAVWIGTSRSGLVRWRNGVTELIGKNRGLPPYAIGSILDDQLGALWLGSNRGILRVRRADLASTQPGSGLPLEFQVFDREDGLDSVECSIGSQPSAARDSQGRLWFATLKGLAVTDPQALRLNRARPRVVIEEIVTEGAKPNDRRVETLAAGGRDVVLRCPPGTRSLEVKFAGLSFAAPAKMRFQYRLEETEAAWSDLGHERKVEFHRLPPGRYELSVRASNNDGVWNPTGTSLSFVIQPFYWQTAWFRTLAALVLMGGVGGAATARWRSRRQEWLHQIAKEREVSLLRNRLASVLEATPDMVAFTDVERRFLYLNRPGRLLLGIGEHEELSAMGYADFHPQDKLEQIGREIMGAAADGGVWQGETRLRRRDGREFPVYLVMIGHFEADQALSFFSSVVRDLSQAKEAQAALEKNEALLRDIINNTEAIIYVKDRAGRHILVNRRFAQVCRLPAEQVIGKTDAELFPGEDAERFRAHDLLVMHLDKELHYEERLHREAETRIFRIMKFPLRDAQGQPWAVCGILADITERKQAELAVLEWNNRYEAAVLASGQVLFDWDPRSGAVRIGGSAMKVLGISETEWTGDLGRWRSRIHPEDRDRFDREIQAVGKTRKSFDLQYRVHRKDSEYITVQHNGQFFLDAHGEPATLIGFLQDITQRTRIEEEQRQADAQLREIRESFTRQLLAAQELERKRIAAELHDSVGQNLVLIRSHALLIRETLPASPTSSHLDAILELSAAGVEEVRTISQAMHPYQLDKLGLTEAFRSMLNRAAETSPTRFAIKVEDLDGLFTKDAETNLYRLGQEAMNNILKHSQATEAQVSIRRDIHFVRMTFSDNGRGLPEKPGSTSPPNPKAGLGFMSMQERVRILGGTMELSSSKGPGLQLTFQIPLPKFSEPPMP